MTCAELWRRAFFFCRRRRMAEDLEEEMCLHMALRADMLRNKGVDESDAVCAARKQFGNKGLLKETSRDMWGWVSIENFVRDLCFAARSLRKHLLFSGVAIAIFALGIGATTAIFSIINGILLRPLPYPQSDRIVHMKLLWKDGEINNRLTVPEFQLFQRSCGACEAVTGFRTGEPVAINRSGTPEWAKPLYVADGFFSVLGVRPVIGRGIDRKNTQPGNPRVAVLSDSLWHSAFAADPGIIGRQIKVDDQAYTVMGIMPRTFVFVEEPADLFLSLQFGDSIADAGMNTNVIARLRPTETLAQAQANINVLFNTFRQRGMVQSGQAGVRVETYQRYLTGDFRTSILMLFAAVGFLLLIACANIASLLMARASSRMREISVRLAIGCSRFRLLQQFLAESLLMAVCGGIAGVIAANWVIEYLASSVPWDIPLGDRVSVDWRVLLFTSLVTLITSIVFGLTSLWQVHRLNLNAALKENSGQRVVSRSRARNALVIGEIALSSMLLIGASLLIESMYHLHQEQLGFEPHNIFTMTTPFDSLRNTGAMETIRLEQSILAHVRVIPGVISAAATTQLPLSGSNNLPTQREAHPENSIGGMEYRAVSPDYFQTIRAAILRGRGFRQSDAAASTPVAVISESVARAWWHGQNPIGDHIVVGQYKGHKFPAILEQPREIVGVVADIKNLSVTEADPTTVYVPLQQLSRIPPSIAYVVRVVRGTRAPSLGLGLRRAVATVKSDQRILGLESLTDVVARSIARPTFDASLMTAFAGFALALASVGIYGLLSFEVTRRTREIGVRMALGAKRISIIWMVLAQGAVLTGVGVGAGVLGAIFLTRLLSNLLVGVRPTSPGIYAIVCVIMALIAVVASCVPALRASRVDPLIALRYE
jgi:putative ABC transport system permease protein